MKLADILLNVSRENFTYQELSVLKCYFRALVFINLEKNDKIQEPIRWNLNLQ